MGNIGTSKYAAELGFTPEEILRKGLDKDNGSNTGFDNILEEEAYNAADVVELAKHHLNFLAGMAIPAIFSSLFPAGLLAVWDLITQYATGTKMFPQIALGIPRGHGKTTLIKLYILYCILFTNKKFILVISATASDAENIIADVENMLNERNIIDSFGDWHQGITMNTQGLKKFGYRGRNIVLMALGVGGTIRGKNVNNERPDVMIFDDIQTKECAQSKVQSQEIEEWMIGTAMKAKSPRGCIFIFAGNMYATDYSILKKLNRNPTWIKLISGAILADGTAFWEELRSLDSLIEELDNDIAAGHPGIFFAEVMNDTEVGVNTNVDFSKIGAWKWEEFEQPQGKMIIIDPASGGKHGDPTSIGYFEVYDEIPALRKLDEGFYNPGDTIRKSLILALETGTNLIAVEAIAYQSTLLWWFDKIATDMGMTGFHFVPVKHTSISKNYRISTMLKSLTGKEIFLHPTVRNMVLKQIQDWNPLKRDNNDGILDLLTFAISVQKEYEGLLATEDAVVMAGATDGLVEGAYSF